MSNTGTVIDLATRRVVGRRNVIPRSVAEIAESLQRQAKLRVSPTVATPCLKLQLDDLTGIADETVMRLGLLAEKGLLTTASAARLALRHASEIGRSGTSDRNEVGQGSTRLQLDLSGSVFDAFAVRVGIPGALTWVGAAPSRRLDLLSDACPEGGRGICLLVDRNNTSVQLLTVADWQKEFAKRPRPRGCKRVEHVIVVGGLPRGLRDRAGLFLAIEDACRRSIGDRLHTALPRGMPRISCSRSALTSSVLSIIELLHPGIVEPVACGDVP